MTHVIREIMSTSVITIRADATLGDAVKVLTEHHLSGAPVVSPQGDVVGFISESGLMDVLFDTNVRTAPISEHMNRNVHVVEPKDTLCSAARLFAMYRMLLLLVVENGALVGVLSRKDLLNYSLKHPEPFAEPLVELIPAIGQFA